MTHYISFPGLGIPEFPIDAVAFTIGSREVRWYGIILTLGIIAAFIYIAKRSGDMGLSFDDLLDYALITVPAAIIGARLYFIAFEYYGEGVHYDSFLDAIAFWRGGIAIYGAVIAGAISVLCISLFKKVRILRMMDCMAPGVMLGQIIGRWGNFVNAEAHGDVTSSLFRMGISTVYSGSYAYTVHPTFLYESVWNLIGFILINIFWKKRKFDGQWLLCYLGWYGLGRGFIEMLRTDSLVIRGTAIRISSVVGFVCFAVGLVLLILCWSRRPKFLSPEGDIYYPGAKNGKEGRAVSKLELGEVKKKNEEANEAKEPPKEE